MLLADGERYELAATSPSPNRPDSKQPPRARSRCDPSRSPWTLAAATTLVRPIVVVGEKCERAVGMNASPLSGP